MRSATLGLRPVLLAAGWTLLAGGCGTAPPVPVETPSDIGVDPVRLRAGMDLAAGYLNRTCDERGQFTYHINLNPKVKLGPAYNIVRHAGVVYSLAMYAERFADEETRRTLERSVQFLKKEALEPIPRRNDLLGVWSRPGVNHTSEPQSVKLGGSGLGLVALLSAEKVNPGGTSMEELRKLGRFLLFMQKKDGSFYGGYYPRRGGRSDAGASLYYPGEAALGLMMLYEKEPSRVWLQGAADAMAYLASERAGSKMVEADHWALMATALLLPAYHRAKPGVPHESIIRHAAQICESILAEAPNYAMYSVEYGCLTKGGTTCGTAARLEGLLAALTFLPEEYAGLRARVAAAATDGVAFLLRAQVREGEHAGALPNSIRRPREESAGGIARRDRRRNDAELRLKKLLDRRLTLVRMDYVQHALGAMIRYDELTEERRVE